MDINEIGNLIEVQLQQIANNVLELVSKIPREVKYIGEGFMSTEGLPAVKINMHLNEIRRILYSKGFNRMNDKTRDVTQIYRMAECAAAEFNPGEQPDLVHLMRTAYMHGYAQALKDGEDSNDEADNL
jgi:hypothetical protein